MSPIHVRMYFQLQMVVIFVAENRPITLKTTGVDDLKDGLAPYHCSLQKNSKHFCSCAIFAPNWIITAAHCLSSIGYE